VDFAFGYYRKQRKRLFNFLERRNKTMKKTVLFVMVLLTLVLAACTGKRNADGGGAAAAGIPTIRFAHAWTGAAEPKNEVYEKMVMDWAEQHKSTVNIKFEATAGMAHQDKIKVDLAAGDLPDMFMYWGGESNLAPMVDSNLILDIDEYCAVSPTIRRDQWAEGTFANFTLNGKAYAFPVESFKFFFIYNKDLFDRFGLTAPKTYSELKEVSQVFIKNGIIPMGGTSKGGDPGHVWYNAVNYQLAGGLDNFNLAKTGRFNTPANLEGAQIIDEMRRLGMFPADTIANGSFENCVILYGEERCAMILCAPWLIGRVGASVLEKSVITSFPKMDNAVMDPADFNLGSIAQSLMITRRSFEDPAKQAAIVDFVDFLLSDEMFIELAKHTMMPAKNVEFGEDAAQYLDPTMIAASEYTASRPTYSPMWFLMPSPNTAAVYLDSIDELFAGAITPNEFITKTQAAFDSEK
jgi:ABC-type glycerol-3-phosphate transport system substrate-binding protein